MVHEVRCEVYAKVCIRHITFVSIVNMYNEQLLKLYGSVLLYDYVYLQIYINHFECTDTNAHTIVFVHTTIHPHNTYNTHHTQPPRMHTYTPRCARRMDSFLCMLRAREGHDRVVEMLLQAEATVDLQTKVENRVLLSIVV